jgi:hypothetical protein
MTHTEFCERIREALGIADEAVTDIHIDVNVWGASAKVSLLLDGMKAERVLEIVEQAKWNKVDTTSDEEPF